MTSPLDEARAYVEGMRARGKTDAEIAARLRGGGWGEELIEELLEPPPAHPAPSPTQSPDVTRLALSEDAVLLTLLSSQEAPPVEQPGRKSRVARGWPTWWGPPAERDTRQANLDSLLEIVLHGPAGDTIFDTQAGSVSPSQVRAHDKPLLSPSGEFGLYVDLDGGSDKLLVVLARGGHVQWRARMGHCSTLECAVTDSGYVIVSADTPSESLDGDVFVFAPTGERIMKKRLQAFIGDCGLSGDAALAWCTTCDHPDNEAVANKLFVYFLHPPAQLFKVDEPALSIEEVSLAGDEVVVSTVGKPDLSYRYTLKGKLLNEQEIAQKEAMALLVHAFSKRDGYPLCREADMRLEATPFEEMTAEGQAVVRLLLERIRGCQVNDNRKGRTHRCLGEIALSCGDKRQAASHFRQAIGFNPKIGLKRQLQELEKELSGGRD